MRPTVLIGVLAGCLIATGCSSGEDVDPGPATASTSTSAEPSPAGDATSAESAGLQVCDLLDPADYNRFIRKDLRASATESPRLSGWSGASFTCTVRSGSFSLFSFSYATDPDAWAAIERITRPTKLPKGGDPLLRKVAKRSAQKREDVPNLADEAFFSQNLGGTGLYALEDGVSFELGLTALSSPPEGVTLGDYLAVMVTLLSNASAGVASEPVQLPSQCPPADSPVVEDLVGEVNHAFGSAYRDTAPSCSYAAVDGRTLRASATVYATRGLYDLDVIPLGKTQTMTLLESPRGTTAALERDGRDWAWHENLPARLETVHVSTDRVTWGPRPTGPVDRSAFLAFVDAYRALASEQLGVTY